MLSDWWNGVELWMAGLAFPFQFAIVMTVLLPVVLVVAWLIDRIVDHASALFGPSDAEDRPIRTAQTEHPEPATAVDDGTGDATDGTDGGTDGGTDEATSEQVPATCGG